MRAGIESRARLISYNHGGRMRFSLKETSAILGICKNSIANKLHNAGITVQQDGNCKFVDVYDIAEYICKNRIAPIDNRSRARVG